MTQTDRGEFAVILELPSGSSLENTNYITQTVEKKISSMPEVRKVFVNVGASNEGLVGQSSNNISELNVTLSSKNERKRSTDDIGEDIKEFVQQPTRNGIPRALFFRHRQLRQSRRLPRSL